MALTDAMSSSETLWFKIGRHDEDATSDDAGDTSTDNADVGDDDEEAARLLADATADDEDEENGEDNPEGAEQLGDKGKRALDRMKAERAAARKEAAAAKKQLADLAKKVQEFEDRDKSELEKATAKAERLAEEAAKATARAVRAEVRALSVDQFADPSDAADILMRDPSKYVDASGEIDEDAIRADLEDLLERKPHWRRPEPAAETREAKKAAVKLRPKPDPGQGVRGDKPVDFRTADAAVVEAEAAKYGLRLRR